MKIATGLATGQIASPDLAKQAVAQAMEKAELEIAASVLLFLTPDFARDPQPSLLAASRASNCTHIVGCSAVGIFTEEDWVLDSPAAAAMVFGDGISLLPVHSPQSDDLILTLAAPNAINTNWLTDKGVRYGGVSGDATGQGPFKVWCGGKEVANGRCETVISGASGLIGISQGIRALTRPQEVTQVNGYDVQSLGNQPALNTLIRELPLEVRELEKIPLHLIMAGITFGEPSTAIAEGRFHLTPIISTNTDDRSITLSKRIDTGEKLFWAFRQPLAAERDMRMAIDRMQGQLTGTPDFGLLFPCTGRGPYFYGGIDRDLELTKQRFPGMPIIGFYGNGEIGPLNNSNHIFQYAAILGLFTGNV